MIIGIPVGTFILNLFIALVMGIILSSGLLGVAINVSFLNVIHLLFNRPKTA